MKKHICDINIRVHREKKQWDHWITGDVEISYADGTFSHIELNSQDIGAHRNIDAEHLASLLQDRFIGMMVRLAATMREDIVKVLKEEE
jgi:hypothetical protein